MDTYRKIDSAGQNDTGKIGGDGGKLADGIKFFWANVHPNISNWFLDTGALVYYDFQSKSSLTQSEALESVLFFWQISVGSGKNNHV